MSSRQSDRLLNKIRHQLFLYGLNPSEWILRWREPLRSVTVLHRSEPELQFLGSLGRNPKTSAHELEGLTLLSV